MDIATIGCAVSVRTAAGVLDDYRIAFGVAGPVPIRCPHTESTAAGQQITMQLLDLIGETVAKDANPRTSWRASREFRMNIIEELARRATLKALHRAGEVIHD